MVDPDTMVVYYFAAAFFQIAPINAYNKTEAEVRHDCQPKPHDQHAHPRY